MLGKIIIGVPGRWRTREELTSAILQANSEVGAAYTPVGDQIHDSATQDVFELDLYGRDPQLREAFEAASQGRFEASDLKAIDEHQLTAYLLSLGQTRKDARGMLAVTDHLLRAGGIAVKIETAGVAHLPDRWSYLAANRNEICALYDAYVVLVDGGGFHFSCGMHNLALPDASVSSEVGLETAANTLTAFNLHQLCRTAPGSYQTFQTAFDAPAFGCTLVPYGYGEDELLNNPHGRWHLTPNAERAQPSGSFAKTGPDNPLFMALASGSPEVAATVRQARATLPAFLAKFESPFEYGSFLFKIRIADGDDSLFLWLRLEDIDGEHLVGEVFEVPSSLSSTHVGDRLRVTASEVYDWSITRCSTLIGGFSRRLQRSSLSEEDRRQYDLFSGIVAYAPVEELPGFTS